VCFGEIASQPRSAEQIFRDQLENAAVNKGEGAVPATANSALESLAKENLGEHLWLISRWYYSNPRQGEILFREKDWPYRRILRACSRLLAPPQVADAIKKQD
jgi:hypothetical protein